MSINYMLLLLFKCVYEFFAVVLMVWFGLVFVNTKIFLIKCFIHMYSILDFRIQQMIQLKKHWVEV